jgi:hypothetical protein
MRLRCSRNGLRRVPKRVHVFGSQMGSHQNVRRPPKYCMCVFTGVSCCTKCLWKYQNLRFTYCRVMASMKTCAQFDAALASRALYDRRRATRANDARSATETGVTMCGYSYLVKIPCGSDGIHLCVSSQVLQAHNTQR